jgi:hypothetical protein
MGCHLFIVLFKYSILLPNYSFVTFRVFWKPRESVIWAFFLAKKPLKIVAFLQQVIYTCTNRQYTGTPCHCLFNRQPFKIPSSNTIWTEVSQRHIPSLCVEETKAGSVLTAKSINTTSLAKADLWGGYIFGRKFSASATLWHGLNFLSVLHHSQVPKINWGRGWYSILSQGQTAFAPLHITWVITYGQTLCVRPKVIKRDFVSSSWPLYLLHLLNLLTSQTKKLHMSQVASQRRSHADE